MQPVFGVRAGGVDITARLKPGAVSMTVSDGVGLNSDSLELQIDNQDAVVAPPRTGQVLVPFGGYRGGKIRTFGSYIVDQVSPMGFPRSISISAQAVGAKSLAKQREPKDYPPTKYPTFGSIFEDVADKAGLQISISGDLAGIENEYEAQGEEDALEFLTRLGLKLDAAVTVKAGRLIIVPYGEALSASGRAMPGISVAFGVNLVGYTSTFSDKAKHKEVEASWYDRAANRRKIVRVEGTEDGPKLLMRVPYRSEQEAMLSAKAQANEIKRAEASASFEIDGDPTASAGSLVTATGCDPLTDRQPWYAPSLVHSFSADSTYTVSITCEIATKGTAGGGTPRSANTGVTGLLDKQGNVMPGDGLE